MRAPVRCVAGVLLGVLAASAAHGHTDISWTQAQTMIASTPGVVVLDVREYFEFCGSNQHIEDAVDLPWNSGVLTARHDEIPADTVIIVVCASGGRSHQAASFLDGQGYTQVHDMLGGMGDWGGEKEACGETPQLTVARAGEDADLNWTPVPGVQDYDLLRGVVSDISSDGSGVQLGLTECLALGSPYTYHVEQDAPIGGEVRFYLTRQVDGAWGESADGQPRHALTCD